MRMAPALACSCWFLLLLSTTYAAPGYYDQRGVWPAAVAGEEPLCRGGHRGRDCCSALHAMGRGWHCEEGEGDCDSDAECSPGLKCGSGNCRGLGFDSTDDCCYDPRLNPHDLLDQSDREPRQFQGSSHGHQDGPSSWLEHSHQGGPHFHVQELNAQEHRHTNVLGQAVEHTHAAGGLGHIHRPFGVLVGGQGGRCDGGDSCCSGGGQCSLGEGDCDDDRECSSGLVCGTDNCQGAGFDSTDDCCRQRCGGGDSCCTRANQCSLGEGDCDEDRDCRPGLVCGRDNCRGQGFDGTDDCCRQRCEGGDSCCTAWNMCKEGEGDCDQDSDCAPGLRCGRDNCRGRGFDSTDDCCEMR